MKKLLILVLAAAMLLSLAACGAPSAPEENPPQEAEQQPEETAVTTGQIGVIEDTKLEALYIDMTIEDFNALGFELGDSVNVVFDNGFTLEDIPYFDGFYVPTGSPLAVGYPGAERIAIVRAQGGSVYKEANANEQTKVTVSLNEKAKYLTVEEAFSLVYANDRNEFASDQEFANFRAVSGGQLKADLFYRSASPFNNQYNRAAYADALCQQAGIQYVIDLADNEEDMAAYLAAEDFASAYVKGLYDAGQVLLLDLSNNYRSEGFAQAVSAALLTASEQEGPFLIQCTEGKDRTGFVCTLILALAGANADEMTADYMETYANYYGLTQESDADKYAAVVEVKENDNLYYLAGLETGSDLSTADFKSGAEEYLRFGGLTDEQIVTIEDFLTK